MTFNKIFLALIILVSILPAQTKTAIKYHPLSGTVNVSLNAGAALGITDYKSKKLDFMTRFMAEYYIPTVNNSIFGFKIFTDLGHIKGYDETKNPTLFKTDIVSFNGGIVYGYDINNILFPYIFGGLGIVNFNPKDEFGNPLKNVAAKNYSRNEYNILLQAGSKYAFTDNMCIDFNATMHLSPNDNLDDVILSANNDYYFTFMIGLSYAFGGEKDDDGDGVPNSIDRCANTPRGIRVDEFGCPVDSDHDGVPDYLDKCYNTPSGVKVDPNGCPIDLDRDGVPDYLDLCPNTPVGIKVDGNGCPIDSDQDGVSDYQDKCPNTPFGVEVDDRGCPKDSDRDGVADYIDKCPDTPGGTIVDEYGCPKVMELKPPEVKKEKVVVPIEQKTLNEITIAGANFAFNKSDLLPTAYKALDEFVKMYNRMPGSIWRIEGYTDDVGKEEGNITISLRRAQSVLDYLVSKGIEQTKFEIVGLGKLNPIADNKTEAGREKNRRVKIIRIK